MAPVEFSRLNANEFNALSRQNTVFFFGVGPLEEHGPELPLGMDLLESYQLCFSAAQKMEREMPGWTGVLMPPAPLGVETNTQKISIAVRPHVLRDWLVDACRSLKKNGFRHFVCFSGHLGPRQLAAIEDAAKIVTRRNPLVPSSLRVELVSASSALTKLSDLKDSLFWPDPKEHGGVRDASLALWMKQVSQPEKISALIKQEREDSWLGRGVQRLRGERSGYWGDPSQADAAKGKQALADSLNDIFPKLRAVWEGSNPNALFRSWYSIIPWNKSFFKSWVLALIAFMILLAWYSLTFRAIR
jgi:creatinine amidohydrolase/Fe(II)-dependent formamide hydrolase-like protein